MAGDLFSVICSGCEYIILLWVLTVLTGHVNSDFPWGQTSCWRKPYQLKPWQFPPPPHLKTGGCQNLWLYDRQSLHPTSFSSPPLVSFLWGFPLCLKFSCLQPCSAQPASKQFMAQKLLIRTALPVDVEPGWSPTLIFLEEFSAWILSWIVGFESWDMSSELALLDSLHTRWAGEKLAFFLCKISQGEQGAGGSSDLGSVFHYAPYWLCEHGQIHFNIFAITFFFSKILKRALIGGG